MLKEIVALLLCCLFVDVHGVLELKAVKDNGVYENDPPTADGKYKYSFQTADIIRREESEVKNPGSENQILVVKGEYSYFGDGKNVKVYYIADENGYRVLKESPFIEDRFVSTSEPPVLQFPSAALGSLVGGGLGK